MRVWQAFVLVPALVFLVGCAGVGHRTDGAPLVAEAAQAAAEEDRILIAYFTATWCGPCRMMTATTWADPRVEAWIEEHGRLIKIDYDENPAEVQAYRVRGIPLTIAFRDGREVDRLSGYREAEEFLPWLEALARGETRASLALGSGDAHDLDDDEREHLARVTEQLAMADGRMNN